MKQSDQGSRSVIEGGDVGALPSVASNARKSEIRLIGTAAVLAAYDVINLVRRE